MNVNITGDKCLREYVRECVCMCEKEIESKKERTRERRQKKREIKQQLRIQAFPQIHTHTNTHTHTHTATHNRVPSMAAVCQARHKISLEFSCDHMNELRLKRHRSLYTSVLSLLSVACGQEEQVGSGPLSLPWK